MIIVAAGAIPCVAAEGESQLEFVDFCPASLSYNISDELAVFCKVANTGTEDIENVTVSITVFDPNGTVVGDYDFSATLVEGSRITFLSERIWAVDENATVGKYTLEAVLRWDANAIQKTTFFYVPVEKEQTTPGLEITSIYTSRLSYKPGNLISCICRIKNVGTEDIEHYLSMTIFDQNGTLFDARASGVYTIKTGAMWKHDFSCFRVPMDTEPGNYTIEAIMWWNDEAVSKNTSFLVK